MSAPDRFGRALHWQSLLRVIRILMVVSILGYLVYALHKDWSSVYEMEFLGSWQDFVLAIALSMAGLLALPAAFVMIAHRMASISLREAPFLFRMWMQGYFFRYVPGKVMLVAERVRLGRQLGISASISAILVIWEQLLIIAGGVIVVVAVLAVGLTGERNGLDPTTVVSGSILAVAAGMIGVLIGIRFAPHLPRIGSRFEALRTLRISLTDQILLVVIYVGHWICTASAFVLICGLFAQLDMSAKVAAFVWFILSLLAGLVAAVAPAGLGVREGVLVLGLESLMAPGPAAALVIATRLWMTLVESVFFAVMLLIRRPATGSNVSQGKG